MILKVKVLMEGITPSYSHAGDAGLDLRSIDDVTLAPGESRLVGTGICVEIPEGYVGLQFPRSGLGSRGITLRNAVGVIDSGYRGEIKCALWNTTDEPFVVRNGDRICQLVIMPYVSCAVRSVHELTSSERGTDGHGSTGVR